MRTIEIVTPSPTGERGGNRVTAERWARMLEALGHRVSVGEVYSGAPVDALVALHARRSFHAIAAFRVKYPKRPLIVGLTGTDLYRDIHADAEAQRALQLADRLVVLQPAGVDELPTAARDKARVIYQSVARPGQSRPGLVPCDTFNVCVAGHLREVKDPMCTAEAARLLPADSRVSVVHAGRALTRDYERQARAESQANPRYRWLGERSREQTMDLIASCELFVLTSRSEGGANVMGEAIVCRTPVVSSRIGGSVGLLGTDYPGYFDTGDRDQLAALLYRAESDAAFYAELGRRCAALAVLFEPAREQDSWRSLLAELGV